MIVILRSKFSKSFTKKVKYAIVLFDNQSLIRRYVPLLRTTIRAFIPTAYFKTKSHILFEQMTFQSIGTLVLAIDGALELLTRWI